MIRKLILQSFVWLIIIGCVSYAVAWALGDPTPTILSPYTIDYGQISVTLYRLDIHAYLTNIQNTADIPFVDMYYDFPMMYEPESWNDILIVLKSVVNAYIWMINVLVWITNIVVLMPTKLLIHPIILILSLLGINTTNLGLVEVANRIYSLNPGPIEYWT